jgi:hypothetical protein
MLTKAFPRRPNIPSSRDQQASKRQSRASKGPPESCHAREEICVEYPLPQKTLSCETRRKAASEKRERIKPTLDEDRVTPVKELTKRANNFQSIQALPSYYTHIEFSEQLK